MSYLDFFRTHAGLTDFRVLSEAKDFIDLSVAEPPPPTRWHAANPVSPYDKVAAWFERNPKETTLFVKDPTRKMRADAKAIEASMEGRYDAANTTADFEIYADGEDGFGGYWAMQLHQEMTAAAEEYAKKHPFKFKVEPVQGKTSAGWKVTISYPTEKVREAEVAAMDALAYELAKKGEFPERGYDSYLHNFIPRGLYDTYLKMAAKKKKRVESVDVEEYVRRVRDVSVRLESSKIVSPADAVVKALNGKQTVGGKLKHAENNADLSQVAFDTPEGDTLDGDDYDYDGVVDAYNQYAKKLEQEARKLLAKAKVTGWNGIYVTNGYLIIGKD